jgi:hypothetical protein
MRCALQFPLTNAFSKEEDSGMGLKTAGELLEIWSQRMKMQDQGVTHPSQSARDFTGHLVEKLSGLDRSEMIEIEAANGENFSGKLRRIATGEILADAGEIDEK